MKPRIMIADTYYPEFLESLPFDGRSTYEVELRRVLAQRFGTFDAYSRHLRALGWDTVDVICNHNDLQQMWGSENGCIPGDHIFSRQIEKFKPDVLFLQDLNIRILEPRKDQFIAAQCSCRMPRHEDIRRCDVIFTSFPHYVSHFLDMGVQSVYLPLAFDKVVLGTGLVPTRDIDISFVGGVGRELHWRNGTDLLQAVAEEFGKRFRWYGYGAERLPPGSPLLKTYFGAAWGHEMYDIYRRSKIVINRHGEVAAGYANNLRMFEATGCGALLVTEAAKNVRDFFTDNELFTYESVEQAIERIQWALDNPVVSRAIATLGQQRTLRDHNYTLRMTALSETLKGMMCRA